MLYYAAYNGNLLPTFRYNLPVQSLKSQEIHEDGLIGSLETSVRNYHYTLRDIPDERRSEALNIHSF